MKNCSDLCSDILTCGFIKKYGETKKYAVKGFVRKYCNGKKQGACERIKFKQNYGVSPSENLSPIGLYLYDE
jgi:hypothetical protein